MKATIVRHHPTIVFGAAAAAGAAIRPHPAGQLALVAAAAGFAAMAARAGRPVTSFSPALTTLAAGTGAAFYLATAHHGYHAAKARR